LFLINLKDVPGIDFGSSGDMTLPKARPPGPMPVGAVHDDEFDCAAMPLPPKNPLPYFRQLKAARFLHTGCEQLRDAGGPVTLVKLGPKWLIPTLVIVTSPRGGHDMLARSPAVMERVAVHDEMRRLMGDNLFDLRYDQWRPLRRALQPLFTKQHVAQFAGHMAQATETLVDGWPDGEAVDLDHECRAVTLRALGRSVLGVDLDAHAEALAGSMRVALTYLMERGTRPLRAPRWLPTPARHRARVAVRTLRELAGEIVTGCRNDPDRDAPLVRALLAVEDPETGRRLSDSEIRDQLIVFLLAGHDTTATTLTYALWQLGRHREVQQRAAAEVAALGERELTADDVAALPFVGAVLQEALRLCPPAATAGREAGRDVPVDGYRIPAGTLLIYGICAVQRDPALWERAEEFDPQRFLGPGARARDRWQYIPFGAGPRSCIGDHFAMLEATLALATIVRRVELTSGEDDFPLALPFTMVAGAPIPAGCRRRAAA